jgi:oxygen-independent coproporphyrinogen-3 oxidase
MILGLRLREGVDTAAAKARFGIDPLNHFSKQINLLVNDGLLEKEDTILRLTHRGLLLSNTALVEFLPG